METTMKLQRELVASSATATPRQALADAALFRSVSGTTLDRLAEYAALHRMPPGGFLFDQAETPAFALFLASGCVELLGVRGSEETLIELVWAPDFLLPAAVVSRQPYLLRVRVLEEASLIMIQAEAFRNAVASDHALCLAVLACQATQFRRQVKRAKNLQLRSAEERVGCYLLRLVEEAAPGKPVKLPVEKRLIASQLGITRETLSRTLSAVIRHGLRVAGDIVNPDNIAAAQARFHLDPLIDGPETAIPLQAKRNRQ